MMRLQKYLLGSSQIYMKLKLQKWPFHREDGLCPKPVGLNVRIIFFLLLTKFYCYVKHNNQSNANNIT